MQIVLAGLLGGLIGSFLNVVIVRAPTGESVIRVPSHCLSCNRPLKWYENIPILSWLALKGRCRSCDERIGVRYPLIEAGTAALFVLAVSEFTSWPERAAMALAFSGLLALAVIDLDCLRVPVAVLYPTIGATAAALAIAATVDDRWGDLVRAGLGAAIGFAALRVIHAISPRAMGYGDVRLAALCGLVLGWQGLAEVAIGLYGAFVFGAVVGIGLIAARRARLGRQIPFAPYLALATTLTALYGEGAARALHRLVS